MNDVLIIDLNILFADDIKCEMGAEERSMAIMDLLEENPVCIIIGLANGIAF